MSVTKLNSTLLSVYLPTFVEGEGSIIRAVMNLNYAGLLLGWVVNSIEPGSIVQSIGISKEIPYKKQPGKI